MLFVIYIANLICVKRHLAIIGAKEYYILFYYIILYSKVIIM